VTGSVTTTPPRGLVQPAYGATSLADVLPGVLTALGVPGATDPLGLVAALGDVWGVAVLLIDGLGHHALPRAAPHTPTIADIVAGHLAGASARAITTGFPSTTPASLVSLGTGAAPGAHGLVGFSVNVPGTDQVLDHLRWRDEPDPLRWQPLTTLFALAAQAGVATRVVSRPEFRDGGLTSAAFRGAEYVAATGAATQAARMLDGLRHRPSLVYGYLPDVDRAGHDFGNSSPQWMEAVGVVDRLVTTLIDGLPAGTALVVTADHGHRDIPPEHRFDVDTDPRLRRGVRVVAGEPRVRYVHTQPGATGEVLATWAGVLGDAAWVVSRDEAVAAGWFGPVPEAHLQRVGDVVAVCRDDYVVLATATEPPGVARMVGFHGSATEDEMRIPLLVVRVP
jgi:Type I phosphodiesterase / nucleotide pyrophosphatase